MNDKDDKNTDRQPSSRSELASKRYFGRQLRKLRETYNERVHEGSGREPILKARPTASALIECMSKAGYEIKLGTYSEIEHGINVPRDPMPFLNAVTTCLRLTEDERKDLAERLAYDLLSIRFGKDIDLVYKAKSTWDD